jgi:methanogenic corrinoid protein MtbC1
MSGVMQAYVGLHNKRREGDPFGSRTGESEGESAHATLSATLRKTIEAEVIPRLMLLSHDPSAVTGAGPDAPQDNFDLSDEVSAFTLLLTQGTHQQAVARVRSLMADGHSSESLLLDLLAPAARLLGEKWANDQVSFTAVSAGTSRLHQLLRLIGRTSDNHDVASDVGTLLLVSMPGDRHVFGLAMVEEFFREAGWSVATVVNGRSEDILEMLRTTSFDVLGVSLAQEELQTELSSLIHQARIDSLNGSLQVLVGGPVFTHNPELCMAVGADATASDGRRAVYEARSLLRLSAADR